MQGKRRRGWVSHASSSGQRAPSEASLRLWPVYPAPGLSSPLTCPDRPHAPPWAHVSAPNTGEPQEADSVHPHCHAVWTRLRPQLLLSVRLFPFSVGPGTTGVAGSWAVLQILRNCVPGRVAGPGERLRSRGARPIGGGGLAGRVTGLPRGLARWQASEQGRGLTREFRHRSPGLGAGALGLRVCRHPL